MNFANIRIHVILDPARDVKMAEHVRLALKTALPYSHAHVPLVLPHRSVKYMRKMHVIRHRVSMAVRVI